MTDHRLKVKFDVRDRGATVVEIDDSGNLATHVSRVLINIGPSEQPPTVVLTLKTWDIESEVDGVAVELDPFQHELLLNLGWIPPVE